MLVPGGYLLLAAWEGEGSVDYSGASDVFALRYREEEVVDNISVAGLHVVTAGVKPVDDFDMDAIHVLAAKKSRI